MMSTKIYYGFTCELVDLHRSVEWLRLSMWRQVVQMAADHGIDSLEASRDFVKEYGEAGFHVWTDDQSTRVLFSLFGMPRFCDRIGTPPAWMRDYAYWNNTDSPEEISEEDWRERGKTWDRIALDNGRWDARLTLIVLQSNTFGEHAVALECSPKYQEAWLGKQMLRSKLPLPE